MADFAGYKLTNLREGRGWEQRTLADRSGVSQSVISALESGKTVHPRAKTVRALAQALDVNPTQLLKRASPRPRTAAPAEKLENAPAPDLNREALRQLAAEQQPLFPAPAPERRVTAAEADRLLHDLPGVWMRLFTGCTEVGFTEGQAMQLLNTAIAAGVLPA